MQNFETLNEDLFQPIGKEELKAMKGGNAVAPEFTISAKKSDPTYQDTSERDK